MTAMTTVATRHGGYSGQRVGLVIDMRIYILIDIGTDMCTDLSIDMCMNMCMDVYGHVYGHVEHFKLGSIWALACFGGLEGVSDG